MKTITSTSELHSKHHVDNGDIWINPDTNKTLVYNDGWVDLPITITNEEVLENTFNPSELFIPPDLDEVNKLAEEIISPPAKKGSKK